MENLKETLNNTKKTSKKTIIITLIILIFILLCITPIIWYNSSLRAVSKESSKIEIQIPIGSGSSKIGTILKENNLIKSELAYKIYIKLNNVSGLQAGTYLIDKSWNVEEILEFLKTGKVMKDQVIITFVEGKNMRWIANKIEESTNNTAEDVYNVLKDEGYINDLINKYTFITSEVKNNNIYYPLEGYLFPETYYFNGKDVTVKEIFKVMLDKMESVLLNVENKTKLTTHELLTMASIVELEGKNSSARKDIASVFYNRIEKNISLGSDVTTYYAYGIDMGERDLKKSELNSYNPYNTRGPNMSGKLPVGPIASPSLSSIQAAAQPNETQYLFFVADKNGKVYFTRNNSEHEQMILKLKQQGLWFIYE